MLSVRSSCSRSCVQKNNMLDINYIRENPDVVRQAIKNKKADIDIDKLLAVDVRRRELIEDSEKLRAEQKQGSKGPQSPDHIEDLKALKDRLKILEAELASVEQEYRELMLKVPNVPTGDTPVGSDESGNVVLREVGTIPTFTFTPKEHWELGSALGILDIERAAKVSGSRFAYLKGGAALMQFALIQFALGVFTSEKTLKKIVKRAKLNVPSKPFCAIVPPVFIKPDMFQKMGRLEPKDDRYYIPSDDLYLVGSAEHTLGSMYADEFLPEEDLPLRYVGYSTAFRREAGSYGKDTRGILRVHQFDKLEMESFSAPEDAAQEQEFFVAIQEHLLQELKLPYRVVAICTGDMGAPDARQIDIETWMPGQNKYRETHTADYMTDYQSRRLGIRMKCDGKSEYVHMNDATAIAVGRTLVAIIENYQTEEGTIVVPKVLRPWMGGIKEIR